MAQTNPAQWWFAKAAETRQAVGFFAEPPPCVVAMQACASAHHWVREIAKLEHTAQTIGAHCVSPSSNPRRMTPPTLKPFAKRACVRACVFFRVRTEAEQASSMVSRVRDLLVRQRSQIINALRRQITEYRLVAPSGAADVARVVSLATDPDIAVTCAGRTILVMLVEQLHDTEKRIAKLDQEIVLRTRRDECARRPMTTLGIGPVTTVAIIALAAPVDTVRKRRDVAADARPWPTITVRCRWPRLAWEQGVASSSPTAPIPSPAHRSSKVERQRKLGIVLRRRR